MFEAKTRGKYGVLQLTPEQMQTVTAELMAAIFQYYDPRACNNNQLARSLDAASKSNLYTDVGTANTLVLTRPSVNNAVEILKTSMYVLFMPKYANTGATTIKVGTMDVKPLLKGGAPLVEDDLDPGSIYLAVWDEEADVFSLNSIASNATYIQTTQPEVTVPATIVESTTVGCTIDNFDAAATYDIVVTSGSVTPVVAGSFTYTAPSVADGADDVVVVGFTVRASRDNEITSLPTIVNTTVTNYTVIADDAIINTDFASNASYINDFS